MSGEIPASVQERVARLQQLQQTLSVLIAEKQRLQAELEEINMAIEELNKSGDNAVVYKSVGPVMVQTSKERLLSELNEKRELDETRIKVLEKQEGRTRAQMEGLQKELQAQLGELQKPPS
ncbi:MAG: prefoldin subunit beta [Aigarchaeota archaeon]|nr:prefoldin subunit beta [Aigarchaeota archaeon]MDW8092430.1 prefoldin subunit beta [Nitrososphaerota archaeon]